MMDKPTRRALLLELAQKLKERESWCGATHLQKAVYFLTELADVPLGYEFVLYRHGPFSFDLQDEIGELQGYGLMQAKAVEPPYGPKLIITERGERFKEHRRVNAFRQYAGDIEKVAQLLGDSGVVRLERLATALYFLSEETDLRDEEYIGRIREAKPHISQEQAVEALAEVRNMQAHF